MQKNNMHKNSMQKNSIQKNKIIIIIGTRPEAIKLSPIIISLQKSLIFEPFILCTGQHTDMVKDVLNVFNITADKWLNINKSGLIEVSSQILTKLEPIFKNVNPKYVCVQGDTTSAMIASIASFYMNIGVIHIEAGLRSNNISNPYPEEYNRKVIGISALYNFCPSQLAKNALLKENITKNIYVVGNTVVDALYYVKNKLKINNNVHQVHNMQNIILVTSHRRENWGKPINNICNAVKKKIALYNTNYTIVYFCHPNPLVLNTVNNALKGIDNIIIKNSAPYDEFISYVISSKIIITDSGGIQEEASVLGIPTVVTRYTTERPEGLAGALKLTGPEEDNIYNDVHKLISNTDYYLSRAVSFSDLGIDGYGNGDTADKIVKILEENK